jgi:hypothetical protein
MIRIGRGKTGVVVLGGGEASGPLYPPPIIDEGLSLSSSLFPWFSLTRLAEMFSADEAANFAYRTAIPVSCSPSLYRFTGQIRGSAVGPKGHRVLRPVRLLSHMPHPRARVRRPRRQGPGRCLDRGQVPRCHERCTYKYRTMQAF